ncbi:MAG: hypothetical protein ACP5LS_04240 [Thermoprotei archaeon]
MRTSAVTFVLILALLQLPMPMSYQTGFVSRRMRVYGVSAQVLTADANPEEGFGFYAWVGVIIDNATVMAGYAVLPSSYWYVNGSIAQLNSSRPVCFYGEIFSNGTSLLFLSAYYPQRNTTHVYSLVLQRDGWEAYYDGHAMGRVPLKDVADRVLAGIYAPAANFAHLVTPVIFTHIEYYDGVLWRPVASGFRFEGSLNWYSSSDPYGSAELNSNASFYVYKGLPNENGSQLWPIYPVTISSYGNLSRGLYVNGSIIILSATNATGDNCEHVFEGWSGSSLGYTGNSARARIQVLGEITEVAVYEELYRVNISILGNVPTELRLSSVQGRHEVNPMRDKLSVYLGRGLWSVSAKYGNVTMVVNATSFEVEGPMNIGLRFSLDYVNLTIVDPLDLPVRGAIIKVGKLQNETNAGGNAAIPANPGSNAVTVHYRAVSVTGELNAPIKSKWVLKNADFLIRRSILWLRLAVTLAAYLLGLREG